jgi:hypothetical protein
LKSINYWRLTKSISLVIFSIAFWVIVLASCFATSSPSKEPYELTQKDYEDGYDYYINGIDPNIDQSQQYGGR